MKLTEETALAILYENTHKKKRDLDIVSIARATEFLLNLYGSQREVAEKVGLSSEMIRQFLSVLKLPIEIQHMVAEREIDSIDMVKELSSIRDRGKQLIAARMLSKYDSKDIRDIKRLINIENKSVEESIEIILGAKPKNRHIFVLDFDDATLKKIREASKSAKKRPADLARDIIVNHVDEYIRTKGNNKCD